MDPVSAISLASSVAGLLTLSGAILSNGYGYVSKAVKAPRELRLLLSETAALHTLLDQLHLMVEPDDGRNATTGALESLAKAGALEEGMNLLRTVQSSLKACEQLEGRGAANLGKRLLWPFKEKETKETLQRFRDLRDTLTSAVSIDSGLALRRLEQTSVNIEGSTARAEKAIDKRATDIEEARLKSWLGLKIVSYQASYEDALHLRHSGTGIWFLEEKIYQEWLSADNSFMWVHGIPGSGKTVLSSTIIQHLQAKVQDSKSGLVYFYCDHRDVAKQTLQNFIYSGLNQLLSQSAACLDDIKTLNRRKGNTLNQGPNQQECLLLLKAFTLHFEKVFVVVDALDESSEVEQFVDGLAKTVDMSESATRAQILVTSRHEVEIQRSLKSIATSMFSLTTNIGDDISRYVAAEVHSRVLAKTLKLRSPSLEPLIIRALSEGAGGMFLWASIQLNHICSLRSDRDIKSALEKLPRGLDETYIRILVNIKSKYYDRVNEVRQVLQWLLVADDVISLRQIAEATSIQPEDESFEIDGVATDPEDVVAILGSLVTIFSRRRVSYARFAHYSIEEFLISDRIRDSNVAVFHIESSMAHAELARTCLQYVSFTDFKNPCIPYLDGGGKNQLLDRAERYQLYTYATNNWFYHLRKSGIDKETFRTMILPNLDWFLHPSPRNQQYYSWEQFLSNLPRGVTKSDNLPPYYYAILFGLDHVLDLTLPEDLNINKILLFGSGLTLLHFASMQGHMSIVQLLIDAGANLNAQTSMRQSTALRLAAENSHSGVVEVLLKAGADPSIRSASGSTAFYGACRAGCIRAMKLLRDAKSDINVKTWDNWTPLMEAVENGHLLVVELLIRWNAILDVENRRGETPLIVAQQLARTDIYKVLKEAIG